MEEVGGDTVIGPTMVELKNTIMLFVLDFTLPL
jgi:hypothetical protein